MLENKKDYITGELLNDESKYIILYNNEYNYNDCVGYTLEEINDLINENKIDANCDVVNFSNYDDGSVTFCDDCGRMVLDDDVVWINNSEDSICTSCLNNDNRYYRCGCCDEFFSYNFRVAYNTISDGEICSDCRCDRYYECDDCGCVGDDCEIHYHEGRDRYLCDDCMPEDDVIKSYHDAPELDFKKLQGDDTELFFGFELEVENCGYNDNNSVAREVGDIMCDDVFFEHDGSLDNGFEIISHPFTYGYFNEVMSDRLYRALKYLSENNFKSHDTSTCGLHFHISRAFFGNSWDEQEKNINKMILFTEYYKDNISKIARRGSTHYCSFLGDYMENNYNVNDDEKKKSIKYLDKYKNNTRYLVINNQNNSTIEFRLCKGTLIYNTFKASLDFIYNLVNVIKNNPLNKISFSKVINYNKTKELSIYLKERNINYNYDYLKDYTKKIENREKMFIKKINLLDVINKKIFNEINNLCIELLSNKKYTEYLQDNQYNDDYVRYLINGIRSILTLFNEKNSYINNDNIERFINSYNSKIDSIKFYLYKVDGWVDTKKLNKLLEEGELLCVL